MNINSDQNNNSPDTAIKSNFWQELLHRKVIRVASVYIVTGWIIIQVAVATFASFGIPDWAFRFVTLMVLLGLPVALVLAWAFELTPDGIKATKSKKSSHITDDSHKGLNKKRNWHAYALGALLPTIIFGALATYFYLQTGNSAAASNDSVAQTDTMATKPVEQSIAVMPLVNMSSHEENVFFAGGIHEDVLTNLSRINNLQVKSRTSMLKYAASDMTLSEIGKELNVDYIVEGSVRRIGNHVRVTIQLIDATNENHLWANNFERELVDSFATQSELSREISSSLHLEIQPESVENFEGMPTSSVKAYDLYMRAASLEKTEGRTEKSIKNRSEMLEEVVAIDPDFVEAWAVLKRLYDTMLDRIKGAAWYLGDGQNGEKLIAELQVKSQRAMQKAMALDPNNVETLLSSVVDNIWPKTMEEMQKNKVIFDKIIESHPEHAKSWYHLGWWYSKLGDMPDQNSKVAKENAAAAFEKSLRFDPFNARIVRAMLEWYRLIESQKDVTRLVERLTQIIPDTANDRSLARVSLSTKQRRVRELFLATADQGYLKELEKIGAERRKREDYQYPISKILAQISLRIFTNEQDELLTLSNHTITIDHSLAAEWIFYRLKFIKLLVYLNRDQMELAKVIAQDILSKNENPLKNLLDPFGEIRSSLVKAYMVSGEGNEDKALKIAEVMLVDDHFRNDETFAQRISVISYVDVDRAVAMAFAKQAKHKNWKGFDELAAYHLYHHQFLTHPRIQEYYIKEGKWINYLVERVPEYAKYKLKAAE
jgi:TolB-like protein